MSATSVRLIVVGLVQGVGFRWFVREQARALKLAGWVRNRDDGAVEAVVHGPGPDVEMLMRALRRGPPGARVDRLDVQPAETEQDFPEPFIINRSARS